MKNQFPKITRVDPILADWGEPSMEESPYGDYVSYYDYMQLYKKFIKARSTIAKNKIKKSLN